MSTIRVGESWPVYGRPGVRRWVSVGFPWPLALLLATVWALSTVIWVTLALEIWLAAEATLLLVSALTCLVTMIVWQVPPSRLFLRRVASPAWLYRWHLYVVDLDL